MDNRVITDKHAPIQSPGLPWLAEGFASFGRYPKELKGLKEGSSVVCRYTKRYTNARKLCDPAGHCAESDTHAETGCIVFSAKRYAV